MKKAKQICLAKQIKYKMKKSVSVVPTDFFGSPSWTRTNDPAVNSRMLYQLSYRGISMSATTYVSGPLPAEYFQR